MQDALDNFRRLPRVYRLALLAPMGAVSVGLVALIHGPIAAVLGTLAGLLLFWLAAEHAPDSDTDLRAFAKRAVDVRLPTLRELVLTGFVVVAVIAANIAVSVVAALLAPSAPARHSIATSAGGSPSPTTLAVLAAFAVVIAPVLEELVFRNGLQKLLAARYDIVVGIVGASAVFASLHIPNYGGFGTPLAVLAPPLAAVFAASVAYGVLYWRTGNFVLSMLAHGATNGLAILAVLVG